MAQLKENEEMRALSAFFLSFLFLSQAFAYEDVPACFRKLETQFFTERNVKDALEVYAIYQSSWQPIYNDLMVRAKDSRRLIKEKAKKEKKNPLEHPFDAKRAKELLIEVQREIFVKTLNYWRVWDERTIEGMFSSITEHNKKMLDGCK